MAKKLPAGWRETFCTLIAEGYTLSDAAAASKVAGGTVRRHMHEDPAFRALYDEARETVRDKVRNRIWQMAMQSGADEVDATTTRWALDHLVKWNLPEAKDAQRIEIGGQVTLTHERRLTLADVLEASQQLDGLGGSTRPELPERTGGSDASEERHDDPGAS